MKLLSAIIALGLIAGVNTAQAQRKTLASGGQGYGVAGCGLGSIVFGQEQGFVQVVAATLNGTGVQTIGITLGTSNCEQANKIVKANEYIEVNQVALENEMARGEGQSLTTLSQVLGCANGSSFSTGMTNNYQSQFPAGGASSQELFHIAAKNCEI